ncbi:hypothetical protein D3C78_1454850 [compost metagenome]
MVAAVGAVVGAVALADLRTGRDVDRPLVEVNEFRFVLDLLGRYVRESGVAFGLFGTAPFGELAVNAYGRSDGRGFQSDRRDAGVDAQSAAHVVEVDRRPEGVGVDVAAGGRGTGAARYESAHESALCCRSPVVEASRTGRVYWPIRPEPAGCVGTLG